jgi:TRAP-type mannitol/chloroaromatic compound transport system substrate-binding protein
VNTAAWAKLKPQTQAQIETTCTAGVTMAIAKAEALQGAVLAKFEKEGVKARQFNKTMLDASPRLPRKSWPKKPPRTPCSRRCSTA